MKRTIILLFLFLLACGFDNSRSTKPAGELINLTGTDYKADAVVPSTVIPPDRPMLVFYSKITCDVSIKVYETAVLKQTIMFRDISGKKGVYIDTSHLDSGLYFCLVTYIRNGKVLKETAAKFVFAKKAK